MTTSRGLVLAVAFVATSALILVCLLGERDAASPRAGTQDRAVTGEVPRVVSAPSLGRGQLEDGVPSWTGGSLDLGEVSERTWVVATPGCGVERRELSLPERDLIPVAQQGDVQTILERLRVALLDDLGRPRARDDDSNAGGAIAVLEEEWRALPADRQSAIARVLYRHEPSADPFVREARLVDNLTTDAMNELQRVVGDDVAGRLRDDRLSWCKVTLRVGDSPSTR